MLMALVIKLTKLMQSRYRNVVKLKKPLFLFINIIMLPNSF